MRRLFAAHIVLVAIIGCQVPSATSTGTLEATASPSGGVDVAGICATTTFASCTDSLQTASGTWPGSLVAICQAPEGGGKVVRLDNESEADSKCSEGGLVAGSRVVKVIRLP